ncbi:hypothetical protein PMAYCL1PPCAC_14165 [Pristionchus mayeri]|uniref:WD40 domain-containing protein n=1 Tax=Pristionchus mayeri TaxID=1317129 RepID=A0AAN5CFB3_9BILA|nr:hypothetical protein PMAYCL1PPCAC_14165 [Pristionchus mayeri]
MRPPTLWDRELGVKPQINLDDALFGPDVVERLDHYKTMSGHGGCVNTLKWNGDGSLLVSGSDDTNVKLWNVEGECRSTYETTHAGNIFGVIFVPGMNDGYIMSCAADANIILTNTETKQEVSKWSSRGRLKRLASTPLVPFIGWSICEDRFVRMHDARDSDVNVKFKIQQTGKSIDASELKPYWLAVASEMTAVTMYDTRNTRDPFMVLGPIDMRPKDPYYVTHVAFSKKSNTLLANFGRGSTYLFDLDDASQDSAFCKDLDEVLQCDTIECTPSPDPPPLSSSVENTIEHAQNFLADLKYVDAFAAVNGALGRRDLTVADRAYLLLKRSTIFVARKREGDSFAAARDTLAASRLLPSDPQPLLRCISVLQKMEQLEICQEMIGLFKKRFPDNLDDVKDMESLISSTVRSRRSFELRRNAQLKRDALQRYTGHSNDNTDIKEAGFFGPNEEYVLAGSDSGHIFVYDRQTADIAVLLKGDSQIVNSVQAHPTLPLIAASGLDEDAHLFAPYNAGQLPRTPEASGRMTYAQAEPMLARMRTRELARELVYLNRLGMLTGGEGQERCLVS